MDYVEFRFRLSIDVSLGLLKAENVKYNNLPPNPRRPRVIHGVLVVKDSSMCITDVDEACKEAGINRHIIR